MLSIVLTSLIYLGRKGAQVLNNGLGTCRWLNANQNGQAVAVILCIHYVIFICCQGSNCKLDTCTNAADALYEVGHDKNTGTLSMYVYILNN